MKSWTRKQVSSWFQYAKEWFRKKTFWRKYLREIIFWISTAKKTYRDRHKVHFYAEENPQTLAYPCIFITWINFIHLITTHPSALLNMEMMPKYSIAMIFGFGLPSRAIVGARNSFLRRSKTEIEGSSAAQKLFSYDTYRCVL